MSKRYSKQQAKEIVGKIVEFQRAGKSAPDIATEFNSQGIKTSTGKTWTPENVYAFIYQRSTKIASSLMRTSRVEKQVTKPSLYSMSKELILCILTDPNLPSDKAVKMLRDYIY